MLFRQLFDRESCTYTYLLADEKTLEAVLIDTVFEHADRDLSLIEELGLKVKYVLETHVHADHVTGVKKIKDVTGARFALNKTSGHKQADILLNDGDILKFGGIRSRSSLYPRTYGDLHDLCLRRQTFYGRCPLYPWLWTNGLSGRKPRNTLPQCPRENFLKARSYAHLSRS